MKKVKLKNFYLYLNKYLFDILFFFVLIIFTLFFWFKQINLIYLDYGEGCYLYEIFLISQKKIIYKDFFAPHPPLFYFFGYLIYKLSSSVYFFKLILMIINILSYIFFYFSIRKLLSPQVAFFSIIFSFFFTNSILRWLSFSGEIFLKFFLSFFLLINVKTKKKNFLAFKALILIFGFFVKYFFAVFIFFYFSYLYYFDKKIFLSFLRIFLFLFLLITFIFLIIFNVDFLRQTIIYRQLIGYKNYKLSITSSIYFLLKFLPFYYFNFIFLIETIKKKDFYKSLVFLIPTSWLFNLYFNFLEGTYLYIFFPIEPIILTGLFLLIFKNKKKVLKVLNIFFIFFSVLSLFYQWQVFPDLYQLAINKYDLESTKKIVEIIKNINEEYIISPPYFAFLAQKKIYNNFHDPFFILEYLKNKKNNFKFKLFEESIDNINKSKPKIIIIDWRIKQILFLINKNYLKKYLLINRFVFYNNESESIEVYKKI